MLNSFYFNKAQKQVVNNLYLQYTRNISKMGAPSKLLFKSAGLLALLPPSFPPVSGADSTCSANTSALTRSRASVRDSM